MKNKPKLLVNISFISIILCIVINVVLTLNIYIGNESTTQYLIWSFLRNAIVGNLIYFTCLKFFVGKINIKTLNMILFIQTCLTLIYQFLNNNYLFIPILLLLIYYISIIFMKTSSITTLNLLYWLINITYVITLIFNITNYGTSIMSVDRLISSLSMLYMIPVTRYMYLYGKSNVERSKTNEQ